MHAAPSDGPLATGCSSSRESRTRPHQRSGADKPDQAIAAALRVRLSPLQFFAAEPATMICQARTVRKPSMTKALAPKSRTVSKRGQLKVQAFTVTLSTPDGEQTVECDGDTYILDAAEVRSARCLPSTFRPRRCSATTDHTRRWRHHGSRSNAVCGLPYRLRAYSRWDPRRRRSKAQIALGRSGAAQAAFARAKARAERDAEAEAWICCAGGRHRAAVLLPRGRLLLVRRQGYGAFRPTIVLKAHFSCTNC